MTPAISIYAETYLRAAGHQEKVSGRVTNLLNRALMRTGQGPYNTARGTFATQAAIGAAKKEVARAGLGKRVRAKKGVRAGKDAFADYWKKAAPQYDQVIKQSAIRAARARYAIPKRM